MKINKNKLKQIIAEELNNTLNHNLEEQNLEEQGFEDDDDFGSLKTATVAKRLQQIVKDLNALSKKAEDPEISSAVGSVLETAENVLEVVQKKVSKRAMKPSSIEKAKATRKANKNAPFDPEVDDLMKRFGWDV